MHRPVLCAWLFLAVFFLCQYQSIYPRASAQPVRPEFLQRHVIGTAVVLNETQRLRQSFPYQCPNGTGYVLDERTTSRDFIGCAPVGFQACSTAHSHEIEGACPPGESCCFFGNRFLGCALSLQQCCSGSICPEGYTCCGDKFNRRCCPLPSGSLVSNDPLVAQACSPLGSVNPCLPAPGAVECPQTVDAALCEATDLRSACGDAQPVYCQDLVDCRYGSDTLLTRLLNYTSGAPDTFAVNVPNAPVSCCPNGGEMCYSLTRSFIGCADPTRNESCCGARICPAGHTCCEYRIPGRANPADSEDTFRFTYVVGTRCCPDELACCTHDIDDISFANTTALAIGATYEVPQATYCGLPRSNNGTVVASW